MIRAIAIAAVAGVVFLAFGARPAAAPAVHWYNPADIAILAPLGSGEGIIAPAEFRYVLTPSARWPQGGPWSLDWTGGGGLPAGHYEGKVHCLAYDTGVQGGLWTAWGHCQLVSPGQGVIVQNPIYITNTVLCPTPTGDQPYTQTFDIHLKATGVYSGLMTEGVVLFQGLC